ncbi:MAG: Fic family protein [Chloroflexota bacterium]|nr:Fic family protein [Chloroflexota bacterium]
MFQLQYHVSPRLLKTIKRVTLLIYKLNNKHVSPPVLAQLQTDAQITSAYASTSIEGNPLPLTDVKKLLKTKPENVRQTEQEVLNYNQVLTELHDALDLAFTQELILDIHHGVMRDLLPVHQVGHWRKEPIVINNPRKSEVVYLPPDHVEVDALINDLVTFTKKNQDSLDPLLLAGLFHKQFVTIHPFIDGNGRTARLTTKVLLAGLGLDLFRLLSFENYYNQNVSRYFQMVGTFGNYYDLVQEMDFTPWLEYFAEGVLDALLQLQKQLEHHQATPKTRLKPYHKAILEYIDEHGFITDRDYAQLTDRAKSTRSLDFNKLIELGIIDRKGSGRGVYYKRVQGL